MGVPSRVGSTQVHHTPTPIFTTSSAVTMAMYEPPWPLRWEYSQPRQRHLTAV